METQTIEKSKQQCQSAADLMPQLICLLNYEGRLLHISRTMERWGLGSIYDVKGQYLHDILHPGCSDPQCYFKRFWQKATIGLMRGRRSECEAFDPILGRHFAVQVQPLVRLTSQANSNKDLLSIVVVDDVSDLKQTEAGFQRNHRELEQQLAHAVEQRVHSEDMQMHLLAILEETTNYGAQADAAASLLSLNPAGRTMFGRAPGENIYRMEFRERSDNDMRDRMREEAIPTAICNGIWSGESRSRDRNNGEISTSQVIIAHRGLDGQVDSFSTIIRNISERARIEQALHESQDELLRLSGLLVTIQEDERRRIAMDLHDGLGQSLSLIKLSIEYAAGQISTGKADAAAESLQQLIPRVKEALHEVRRVSTELRPSILDDLGILPTLSWFFREFEASCSHITVEKVINISEQDVPASLKITIYRILQEATSNIVKHSGADHIRVSLELANGSLQLQIKDNGCGFDPASIICREGSCRGLGLLSMKERAICSKGIYLLESSPRNGTCLQVSWPCAKDG